MSAAAASAELGEQRFVLRDDALGLAGFGVAAAVPEPESAAEHDDVTPREHVQEPVWTEGAAAESHVVDGRIGRQADELALGRDQVRVVEQRCGAEAGAVKDNGLRQRQHLGPVGKLVIYGFHSMLPKKGGVLVGFREKQSGYLAVMDSCEVLDERFSNLILPLRELIAGISIARRIPQIEVAAGDHAAVLVFRHLEPLSETDKELLRGFGQQHSLSILLQPGGPDSIQALYPEKQELLEYRLDEWDVSIRFRPTDFTQVNASINQLMISLALELLEAEKDDEVLDLFCGIGNFTLPLARVCKHVTGIEGDSVLVKMARENASYNNLSNAEFITANLYDTPLDGSWLHRKWDRILLDPPRSGAMEVIERLPELGPRRIVYVSCNPATLARDTDLLVNKHGYRLKAAGVMDMFPHTKHVESIAVFDPA